MAVLLAALAVITKPVALKEVNPVMVDAVLPRLMLDEPIVIELLVSELLPMFDNVFDEPLIVLFDSVCEPLSVATVESMVKVRAAEPSNVVPVLSCKPVLTVSALVVDAVMVPDAPKEIEVPLTVTPLLVRDALPMLVRVLVAPLMVTPAKVDRVPPRLRLDEPMVTALLVNELLPMLDRVLFAPLIVLLVNVSVVARPTRVSVEVGRVRVPVLRIVPITGLVSVLFVNVSVVLRPTRVSVDVGSVSVPVLTIVPITGLVKVLLVKVWVTLVPTKVVFASGIE
jgi:hypothetical protein